MADQSTYVNLGFTPERFPKGVHVCHLFSDEVDRRSVIYPFVRAGLQGDEDVHYFADALVTELLERAIDERTAALLTREQLSRLHITSVENTYFPDGAFSPAPVIDHLEHLYKESRDDGATGCRVTGEMGWALRGVPGSERLAEYESEINTLIHGTPLSVVCQYDTEIFDGATLFSVLAVHPLMIVRGQVLRNPSYVEPDEFEAGPEVDVVLSQEIVLARLFTVQLIIGSLPDEQRVSEFLRCAILQVPGVRDVHVCLSSSVIPPDGRFESVRQQCARSVLKPNSFDVPLVEAETGSSVFLLRTTSRLFGVVLVDVGDETHFFPYRDVLANIANTAAMTLEARRSQAESHAWPERVANLERRLWRIAREFEGAGVLSSVTSVDDPYALPGVAELSPRQWEVLTRLLQGERVPRIAEELFLSQSTVRNHLADMFRKMGVHSQEELLDLFRSPKSE